MNVGIQKAARATDIVLKFSLVVLLSALVLSTVWQVASRYLLGDPSSWTEELARFTLIWAGLLGAVYAYRTNAHVGIDVLTKKLPDGGRRIMELISALCVVVFSFAVVVVGGINLVFVTAILEQRSAALGWQMAWVYSIVPISGLLLVWYASVNFIDRSQSLSGERAGTA